VQLALDNPKMRFSTSSVLLAASSLLGTALAHNIRLAAHGRECFHEMLHVDDKMTVTFQVGDREFGSAGNLDIDFWVCLFPRVYFFSY
jgi:p24 family protein beta-1